MRCSRLFPQQLQAVHMNLLWWRLIQHWLKVNFHQLEYLYLLWHFWSWLWSFISWWLSFAQFKFVIVQLSESNWINYLMMHSFNSRCFHQVFIYFVTMWSNNSLLATYLTEELYKYFSFLCLRYQVHYWPLTIEHFIITSNHEVFKVYFAIIFFTIPCFLLFKAVE